jgi:hypothetical protein
LRGRQPLHEAGEEAGVIEVHLGVRLDLRQLVAVVRDRVVRLGDADGRIGALAQLAREHEGADAREVGLERESPAGRTSAWRGPRTASGTPDRLLPARR